MVSLCEHASCFCHESEERCFVLIFATKEIIHTEQLLQLYLSARLKTREWQHNYDLYHMRLTENPLLSGDITILRLVHHKDSVLILRCE